MKIKLSTTIGTAGILILCLLDFCSAYQYYCYVCTNCNDPFTTTSTVSTVLCNNGCYKNVVKSVLGQQVERGCSQSPTGCQNYIYGPLGLGTYNYCCWNNYCNHSVTQFSASKVLTLLLMSLFVSFSSWLAL